MFAGRSVTEQGPSSEFERAGVWRRLAALLIDVIAIAVLLQLLALVLYPLSHGRIQYAGGVFALSCNKLDKVPEGAAIPPDFNANSILDCHQTVFGLTAARILHVARTTHEGLMIKSVQVARMLDADGVPVTAFSLGILALPLLIGWRLSFDLGRGSPGRRACGIRLASAADAGRPSTAAVRWRYALLFVVFSPFLIWSIAEIVSPETAADPGWLLWIVLASYCPGLIVLLQAWRAAFRREDPWHDRFAGTCVLRTGHAAAKPPVGFDPVAPVMGERAGPSLSSLLPQSIDPTASRGRQNYFARHWRGELSLPQSWWVNGFVLGIAVAILVAVLATLLQSDAFDDRPFAELIGTCTIWLGIALLMLWQGVGIWRAAAVDCASANGIWSAAARATLVLAIASVLWNFLASGLPRIVEVANIAAGDPQLGPHEFQTFAADGILEFSGGITFGVAKELASQLDAMPDTKTVRLNSLGGRIREAQRMSNVIKAHGLSTLVEKQCLSACTIVFLGGVDRAVTSQARLGFHQPTTRGLTEVDRQAVIKGEEERLQTFGLSRAFAERANQAEPTSMWYPDEHELLSEHVATRIVTVKSGAVAWPPLANSSAEGAAAPVVPAASIPLDVLQRLRSPRPSKPAPSPDRDDKDQ